MGYSDRDSVVRVDFFKQSGKWYTTEAVEWIGYDGLIFEEFKRSLWRHLQGRLSEMWAVCLEPYNKYAHPLMVRVPQEPNDAR